MKQGERKVKIKAADYVWCRTDECLVPRSKLTAPDSIFDDDDSPACPFCGGTEVEDIAAKRAGDDEPANKKDSSEKDKDSKVTFA